MNINDLRPASTYAQKYGAKSLVYGAPGTGKTPIANTAPRPVLCVTEPGMLSMRNSSVPAFPAFTPKAIDEFFAWAMQSTEMKNFDTICVDSVTQMAEIYLAEAATKYKDGRQAYGKMQEQVMKHLNSIYYLQNKHVYLIAKLDKSVTPVRPYFPGKALNVDVPHLFDIILHLDFHNIPGFGQQKAFRTTANFDSIARDRSGKLAEFEPCDLAALFRKAMS